MLHSQVKPGKAKYSVSNVDYLQQRKKNDNMNTVTRTPRHTISRENQTKTVFGKMQSAESKKSAIP
jgi:hypothetical protein